MRGFGSVVFLLSKLLIRSQRTTGHAGRNPGPSRSGREDGDEVAAEAILVSGELGGEALPTALASQFQMDLCNPLTSAEEPQSTHQYYYEPVRLAVARLENAIRLPKRASGTLQRVV